MDSANLGPAMAESAARATALSVDDALVLIGWLASNIRAIHGDDALQALPELPSQMQGFGCIQHRSDAVKVAMRKIIQGNQ